MPLRFLGLLSSLCGWIYTIAWCFSFYPQPLLNWRRKSTAGATIDFPLLNILGYISYAIYNSLLLHSPTVRRQYAQRNGGHTPTAQINDLIFSLHGCLMCVITLTMYIPGLWPGFSSWSLQPQQQVPAQVQAHRRLSDVAPGSPLSPDEAVVDTPPSLALVTSWRRRLRIRGAIEGRGPKSTVRPSSIALGILAGCLLGLATVAIMVAISPSSELQHHFSSDGDAEYSNMGSSKATTTGTWMLLDLAYAFSYVKMLVTVVKYVPQLLTNLRLRSTRGWSMWQVVLDMVGGAMSISQQLIDSYAQGNVWGGIAGNPAKFALGNVSLSYDMAFFVQHWMWSREGNGAVGMVVNGAEEEAMPLRAEEA